MLIPIVCGKTTHTTTWKSIAQIRLQHNPYLEHIVCSQSSHVRWNHYFKVCKKRYEVFVRFSCTSPSGGRLKEDLSRRKGPASQVSKPVVWAAYPCVRWQTLRVPSAASEANVNYALSWKHRPSVSDCPVVQSVKTPPACPSVAHSDSWIRCSRKLYNKAWLCQRFFLITSITVFCRTLVYPMHRPKPESAHLWNPISIYGFIHHCIQSRHCWILSVRGMSCWSVEKCGDQSLKADHYFRSVCWFVCLSVCLFVQSFSQPSLIRFRSN